MYIAKKTRSEHRRRLLHDMPPSVLSSVLSMLPSSAVLSSSVLLGSSTCLLLLLAAPLSAPVRVRIAPAQPHFDGRALVDVHAHVRSHVLPESTAHILADLHYFLSPYARHQLVFS